MNDDKAPDSKLMLMPDRDPTRAIDLSAEALRQLADQVKIPVDRLLKRLISGLPHPRSRHLPPELRALLSAEDLSNIEAAERAREGRLKKLKRQEAARVEKKEQLAKQRHRLVRGE